MGDIRVLYVGFVSRVVHNQAIVGKCIVDPFLQLLFRERRPRRVVRVTEVDDVYAAAGQFRDEVIGFRAGDVHHVAPFSVFQHAGPSAHHVRVDVGRVDRVCHSDAVVVAKHVAYVSAVAFGAVADEHFAGFEEDAAAGVIVLDDGIYQKRIPLFRSVSMKCILARHIFDCLVHRFDNGRG